MRLVSYNIQYGVGLDGRYDLARIADAVRGADVIALQEVTRNSPKNGGHDMVAGFRDLLPDYFAAYGPNFEVDIGSRIEDGRATDVRFQFGNMVLSKTPILSSRNILLPRRRSLDKLNFQRGALEAMVDTPFGPVRFYSVHLDHRGPDERALQIAALMERALGYVREGGALTGVSEMGFPEPPHPEAFVLMGDFNMVPFSREYFGLVGHPDHSYGVPPVVLDHPVDAALCAAGAAEPQTTYVEPADPADSALWKRIDYCFVHASLAARVKASRVDQQAVGSDHQPLWLELG